MNCVTSGKSLHLSELPCPHVYSEVFGLDVSKSSSRAILRGRLVAVSCVISGNAL